MVFYIGIKAGDIEILINIAFQLAHLDAVGCKAAQGLVESGRDVANLKDETCLVGSSRRQDRNSVLPGKDSKYRGVMRRILNILS